MGILQKKSRTREKGRGVQGKRWPKYRKGFSCLKVRGGSLPSNWGNNFTAYNHWGINCCDEMIGAAFPWKPQICCCLGINRCDVILFL